MFKPVTPPAILTCEVRVPARRAITQRLVFFILLATASLPSLRIATAQSVPAPSAIPSATQFPPLDVSAFSLRAGNQYRDCPNTRDGEAACTLQTVDFDGPSGADGHTSQAARRVDMTAFGPGLSLGNLGGWRVHKIDVGFFTISARGISQARSLIMQKHASGDTMGTFDYVYSDGGSTALSDEAIKGYAVDMGETSGYFHGTVASTTGTGDTAPALAFVSGNDWTTDGAPLLDISKGTISGHITGPSAPLQGSAYLGTFPVDNDLPLTTAWGICNDPIPWNHLVQTATPVTCRVSLKLGQFEPGGTVCVTGPNYPEQAPITDAGPVLDGTQTITLSLRNSNEAGANILQGGLCGQYISFDANLALSGYRTSYYAFGAIDPHHLIFGQALFGYTRGGLPMLSEAEKFGVPGRNGYHLYPGCEVIDNKSIKADPVCEPNSVAWSVGDTIEAPHNVSVNTVGLFAQVTQNTPANGSLSSGDLILFNGMGAVGPNFIARRTINNNPYKLFNTYGGLLPAPDMHRVEGYFNSGLSFGDAPAAIIRVFGNADGSQTPMTLFAMPGGEVTWNPATSTLQAPRIQSQNFAGLRGTSEPIGGAPLALGTCATGMANIPGATMNMVPTTVASTIGAPGFSPNGAFQVTAQVTAANQVTVSVCAIIAGTPRPSNYIVALQ
jgi:hypothetical protein